MSVQEIKRYIENNIKPYKYRYELDQHTNQYYFILYNFSLKHCFIGIPKRIMKDEKLMKSKMNVLKIKYENL